MAQFCAACPVSELGDQAAHTALAKFASWREVGRHIPLTESQTKLVQSSFTALEPDIGLFARVFYARMFAENPHIRFMFKGEQEAQEKQLTHMLGAMIRGLDRLEDIKPSLWALGRRHVKYGVRAQDYDKFFDALLWTLRVFLGAHFTREVEQAWAAFLAVMFGLMLNETDWRSPGSIDEFHAT